MKLARQVRGQVWTPLLLGAEVIVYSEAPESFGHPFQEGLSEYLLGEFIAGLHEQYVPPPLIEEEVSW